MKRIAKKIRKDIITKPKQTVVLFFAFVLIWSFLGLGAGWPWFLLMFFILHEWDSVIVGVLALVIIAICPFLISFGQDFVAEQMAVYAYFFLIMFVVSQIVEQKRDE